MRSALRSIVRFLYPSAFPVYHPHRAIPIASSLSNVGKKLHPTPRTVLVTGWAGAKRKHLARLVDYYNDIGFGVITCVMPLATFGFVRDFIEDWVSEEVALRTNATHIELQNLEESSRGRLVVHLFSNNGAWSFSSLMMKGLLPLPHLVIWDSSPYLFYEVPDTSSTLFSLADGFSRALTSIILQKPIYSYPYLTTALRRLLGGVFRGGIFVAERQGQWHVVPRIVEFNRYLRDHLPIMKMLFIYSTGDALVKSDAVEEFIGLMERRSFSVERKVFGDDVSHTSSFYMHPREYKAFVEPHLE